MSKIKTAIKLFVNNRRHLYLLLLQRFYFLFSDKYYLKILYRIQMRRKLSLDSPKTFTEKLQWLKLYNRNPDYIKMVDKYNVKSYVINKIGAQYVIPTLGIWKTVNEIDWDTLPNQFVIKTIHGGGGSGVILCKDKSQFDIFKTKRILNKSYSQNIYNHLREWPYKGVQRGIIAEKMLIPEDNSDLKDYKVLCFNGKPKLIELHSGRYTDNHTQDFYDIHWNRTDISQGGYGELSAEYFAKPSCLEEMLRLSEVLAQDMPHVRIDWYYCNNKLYFGEITFFDGSGFDPFDNYEDDLILGSWIDLELSYSRRQNKK